jgi:hypothetical protein
MSGEPQARRSIIDLSFVVNQKREEKPGVVSGMSRRADCGGRIRRTSNTPKTVRSARASPSNSAVVVIAHLIRWPVAVGAVWASGATLAATEAMGQRWPRAGLELLDVGEQCGRLARRLLQEQLKFAPREPGREVGLFF